MRGARGVLVGLALFVIGFSGLGFAIVQMMTHADPNANAKAAAGLATFIIACLVSLAIIRS